jgi:molybdenum cofactor biosynthesis enzyme MoaA
MEYLSCKWIESRVVLDLDRLRFCCIPHSGNKGYVKICDYTGGPLPVEEIREARRRLTEQNNDPAADSECKGCHFLEKRDWDAERPKAMFDAVYVSHFSMCNLRCRYCYVYLREGDLINIGYNILPLFQGMIADGHLEPGSYVEWGGGEPTILREFPEVQALLRERGCRQQVSTSGVRFSPEIEQGLLEGSMQAVTSVDAGTRESYQEVKGRDAFEKVWENVTRYARTGGDMTVKYILRSNNSSERNVREFVRKLAESGARKLVITPDQWEISQEKLTEETCYAFSLMKYLARRKGISVLIRDEYASPQVMRRITRYEPAPLHRLRFEAHRLRTNAVRALDRTRRRVRRVREAERTRASVKTAVDLLERDPVLVHPFQLVRGYLQDGSGIAALLERQVSVPDGELRERVSEILRRRPDTRRYSGGILSFGFSPDGWTIDGRPGYLFVDGKSATRPFRPQIWFACNADQADCPVKLTVSDGIHEDVEYTYLQPERRRFELPEVQPGTTSILAVRTDKSWRPATEERVRNLGVRVSDMSGQ